PVTGSVYSNPGSKQFIGILSNGLDTMLYSTVFGDGSSSIKLSPAAFLVDRCGNIYCSGWGGGLFGNNPPMNGMPVTSDAYQPNSANGYDFYFIVLGPYLQILEYGSYFGGGLSREHVDGGTSRFDSQNGILYQSVCAGCQNNDDFPTTAGAWSNVNNSTGCNNGVIKMDLNVLNTRAAFTSFPKEACPYVNVSFTNNSVSAWNFYWNFGDGSPVSNAVNPTHAFSGGGTYIVQLISSSPFCGIDTTYDTIQVYFAPIAAFTDTGTFCGSSIVQFTNNSTSPASYLWNFGDGDTSSVPNPSHLYSPGNYVVNLYVTDSLGCKDTATQNVIIHPLPVASINFTLDTCALNADFTGNPANASSYQWDFGDTSFASGQTVSHSYQQSGNYTVTLLLTDINGCMDTATVVVPTFAYSIADFSYVIDSCFLGVSFTNQSFNLFTSQWDLGDLTTPDDTSSLFNPNYIYPDTGYFTITLVINAGTQCADTITKVIQLTEPFAKASFTQSIDTCSLTVYFINQSTNVITSKWIFDNLDSSSSVNVIRNYPRPGTYTVTLIVNEGNRCKDDTSVSIVLDEQYFAEYFIPNIFTPNNDGYNQRFVIQGTDFCGDFHIQIYNRWGELKFESSDITDAWDGTWKGKDVPDGVYFYIINGSRIHKTGTVTVKRK
ncbi:MAG: PKD domain-containing protein, partial [Bacteroidia bacterium]|nr:PKD domain-containing protein [Bacteroidia bacterium]